MPTLLGHPHQTVRIQRPQVVVDLLSRDADPDASPAAEGGTVSSPSILSVLEDEPDADGTLPLQRVVEAAHERYATHPLSPKGRVRNYCTFTKVDLEARCEIERLPGASPQRISLWRDD